MMKHLVWILALSAVGCDKGTPPRAKATVTLTSVAFADDCGGTPPHEAPAAPARREPPSAVAPSHAMSEERVADEGIRRRCEQTSMQLVVDGEAGTELHIKSVEVFDSDGKSLGKLSASKPTRWDEAKAAYEPWDEKVGAASMAISYVLSQPSFVDQWDARDRTYTVKVVAAVGGIDKPLKATVLVVGRPPPVPT
jgi:hypothetical protein